MLVLQEEDIKTLFGEKVYSQSAILTIWNWSLFRFIRTIHLYPEKGEVKWAIVFSWKMRTNTGMPVKVVRP